MLTLGLPSKGRLMADTIDWFAARGIPITRPGGGREYWAEAEGVPGLQVVMLAAGEVPRELMAGRIDLGVTGEDLIRERVPNWERHVALLAKMGFGHADLVVAVPAFWVDVETMADLDEVAADFRAAEGRSLRVATKYHNLARAHFRAHGVADYRLIDSQGATEAGPKNLTAEVIVDITSSGETLRANHLRPLSDGPILRSEANLCLARAALDRPKARAVLEVLSRKLGIGVP